MEGMATPAQIGAFLMGLRVKGEGPEEIAGMATAMRERCAAIRPVPNGRVVDLCGTGGAPLPTFNVSTISMFVVAAAGVTVAKHGNRAVTSACGSADLLEALGARVDLEPPEVERILQSSGLCFMFAPKFHPAMRYAMGPRRELGVRTVFNILGPLTNPAGARSQLLGAARPEMAAMIAAVLARLGTHHALVVHGQEGLDEISLAGPSTVHEVCDGAVRSYELRPEDVGLRPAPLEAVRGGTPEENAARLRAVLSGERGPLRDIVVLNAAAALVAADIAGGMAEGIERAAAAIDSGAARERLDRFIAVSRSFAESAPA